MKKRLLFVVVAVALACGGCGGTSQERLTTLQNMIEGTQAVSLQLDQKIADVNSIATAAMAFLNDPNIPQEYVAEVKASLSKALETKLVLLQEKGKIDDALRNLRQEIARVEKEGAGLGDEIAAYGKLVGVAAPALPVPANGIAVVVSGLLAAIGGWIVKSKKDTVILKDVVHSVDKVIDSSVDKESIKAILKGSQDSTTRNAVKAVR